MTIPEKFNERLLNHHPSRLGMISMYGHLPRAIGISRKKMRVLGKYALVYVLRGQGRYRDKKGHDIIFRAGGLIHLFPEIAHCYEPVDESSWDEIYFIFSGPQFDLLRKQKILDPAHPVRQLEPEFYWRTRFLELIENQKCSSEKQSLREVLGLSAILTEINCAGSGANDGNHDELLWLEKAQKILSTNNHVDVDFQKVSREMNVSYETFRKRFTQLAGLSPGRYHMRKLMEKAAALIVHEHLPNKDIADKLGFCDEFHFSKRFRSVMGMSPRSYRLCLPRA